MNETTRVHPAMGVVMARRNIPASALRSNGQLALTVDGKHRIRLRPAPDGRLALQAKVMTLPEGEHDRIVENAIRQLMQMGSGMLRDYAATLCFERRGQDIQLQQVVAADVSGEQLDAELAEFINALDFWVRIGKSL